MSRRYLPVKAAALAAAGLLLSGTGMALAAPDSNNDKGGGKPSSAASSAGNSGSNPGNAGSAPGKTGSNPGNKGAAPGKNTANPGRPASTPGGNSPASPAAGAAIGKANPAITGNPNAFGKAVAAAASSQSGQGGATGIETPVATTIPADAATAAATVPVSTAGAHSTPANHNDRAPAAALTDHQSATPVPPKAPPVKVTPEPPAQHGAPAAESVAAALSVSRPQSAGDTGDSSPAAGTEGSWIGRVAGHVADEVREALREVTLKDLAVAALPGLLGILFFFGTGIGLGHRQARFGFALESTGALRFAIRAPLGVVRPGGFISVPGRAGRRRGSPALLDRAA